MLSSASIAGVLPKRTIELTVKEEKKTKEYILETLTIYHPVESQCDSDPLITASMKKINLEKLRTKQLRWMAMSRDLLKRWGGEITYGDTVVVITGDDEVDGKYVVQDTMNRRYKNRGDLLFHPSVRKLGKWKNVKIIKHE